MTGYLFGTSEPPQLLQKKLQGDFEKILAILEAECPLFKDFEKLQNKQTVQITTRERNNFQF